MVAHLSDYMSRTEFRVTIMFCSSEVPRLRQSLSSKQDTLSKRDDEMIELVMEEELEQEVEQADVIKEMISLALMSIDETLEAIMNPPVRHGHPRGRESRSLLPESVASEEHVTVPSAAPAAKVTATTETHAAHLHIPTVTVTVPTPLTSETNSATAEVRLQLIPRISLPSVSSSMATLPSLSLPTTTTASITLSPPSTTLSGMSTLITSSGHGTVSSTLLPTAVMPPSITSSMSSIPPLPPPLVVGAQVKLPKLSIRKFNGDLTKWVTFWDSFNCSIHTNPILSSIDKFNYLTSLLESTAVKAITGLTLTLVNYDKAIATPKKRFGNPQLIVNQHMEALLYVAAVSTHHDVKGLRRLHDSVEAHVCGLRALGVPPDSYGGLLTSVLVNKLPPEIRLIVSRAMTGESWDLDQVMKIFEQEVDARERASLPSGTGTPRGTQSRTPTTATIAAGNSPSNTTISCVFCNQKHPSASCTQVVDVPARKEILRRAGRCYVCLKRHHLSKDCRSSIRCEDCRGRYHVTICHRRTASHPHLQDHLKELPMSLHLHLQGGPKPLPVHSVPAHKTLFYFRRLS